MNPWWIVGVWTGVGLTWWIASYLLVITAGRGAHRRCRPDTRRLTVFKPLPRLDDDELSSVRPGLESFVAALDGRSELLVGCHESNRTEVESVLGRIARRYPGADVRCVVHREPRGCANPKVAWMRILAAHATGDLWLWSDADIRVPANAIRSLRVDLAATGAGMLTAPYVVRHDNRPREMLDALFVNVEFYPGVVLLGRMDLIRFGFGSGMLFEAEAFRRKVDWSFLGECLAEDYHLGRLLAPSGLGTARFETSSSPRDWRGAILHYLRWQKTIRWCRPGSYLAQLIVLPVLGWMAMVLVAPTHPAAWGGLLGIVALDGVTALAIFRSLGYPIRGSALSVLPVWSLLRGLTWLACWLPWPIVWRGHLWWTPRRRSVSRPGVVGSKRPASD